MVQLKYFGDSRNFFKYDLITTLLQSGKFKNYVFIPMLTEHRDDNQGNISQRSRGEGKSSKELLEFIKGRNNKTLQHWRCWLEAKAENVAYAAIEPADCLCFADDGREEYWRRHKSLLTTKETLVFVDPDTGLETGTPNALKKKGREKYMADSGVEVAH